MYILVVSSKYNYFYISSHLTLSCIGVIPLANACPSLRHGGAYQNHLGRRIQQKHFRPPSPRQHSAPGTSTHSTVAELTYNVMASESTAPAGEKSPVAIVCVGMAGSSRHQGTTCEGTKANVTIS